MYIRCLYLFTCILCVGCQGFNIFSSPDDHTSIPPRQQRHAVHNVDIASYVLSLVGENYKNLDSSSFVRHVYKHVHGIDLPRTSADIKSRGAMVDGAPSPGDLIFFDEYSVMGSAIGIYVGGNQFVYSSGSSGDIKKAGLGNDYYTVRIK